MKNEENDIENKSSSLDHIREFDDLLKLIGSQNKFQKFILYGLLAPISFLTGLLTYGGVFTLFVPDHFCAIDPSYPIQNLTYENETIADGIERWREMYLPTEFGPDDVLRYSQCLMYSNISDEIDNETTMGCVYGWEFDKTDFDETIPTEFNWVCSKEFYSTNVFLFGQFGGLLGTIFLGQLADKVGRKPILFISHTMFMLFNLVSLFLAKWYELFLACYFISCIGFPMMFALPSLVIDELVDNNYRAWASTVEWITWVVGMSLLPVVAYFTRHWFSMSLIVTLPGFLIFLTYPIFPESPRWLISRGKIKECAKIVQRIAKVNKTSDKLSNEALNEVLEKMVTVQKAELNKGGKEKTLGVWTLLSTKRLAIMTILITICWTSNTMIYEQITLNTPYMNGNQFINFFIMTILELPGSVAAGFLVGKVGRRWPPVVSSILSLIACFVAGFIPYEYESAIIGCVFVAKFSVSVNLYVIYLQANELFPTPLRSTGQAFASTISASLGLLNPVVVYLGNIYAGGPYLFMAGLSIITGIAAAFLPETFRHNLPETVEDAENFGKGNKFWSLYPENNRLKKESIQN